MKLPCTNCKHRTEREDCHRKFIGCSDKEREDRGFKYDDLFYWHKCTEWEIDELKEV